MAAHMSSLLYGGAAAEATLNESGRFELLMRP